MAYTIWTPNFSKSAKQRLASYAVTDDDIALLQESLKKITCNALTRLHGDIQSVEQLSKRRDMIISSQLPAIDKAIVLLDDCKRFGTLAFAQRRQLHC